MIEVCLSYTIHQLGFHYLHLLKNFVQQTQSQKELIDVTKVFKLGSIVTSTSLVTKPLLGGNR